MAIATSTKLIGKNVVLLDGTKTKITDAMATGYKVADRTVRVNSKQLAKKGAAFYEIPNVSLRELNDTGEGYVEFADKAMQKKVGTDAFLEKASSKKPAGRAAKAESKPAKTSGRKPRAPKEEVEEKPTSKIRRKPSKAEDAAEEKAARVTRRKKPDAGFSELADFLINGKKTKESVLLAQVDQELATVLTERLVNTLQETSLAKFDANNAKIDNAFDVGYSTEFDAAGGDVRVTLNIKYALVQPEPEAVGTASYEISAELAKKIKLRVGKVVGKKLQAAIAEHLEIEASEFTAGSLLSRVGEDGQFVFCGASKDDSNKAVLFNIESEKFRTVSGAQLENYSLIAEEEEEEEEDEPEDEEEEEEEEEDEPEEEEEESDDDSGEGEEPEYEYQNVTKAQLAGVDKDQTKENVDMLAELWGVEVEALSPGLKVTDGDDTYIYVGFDEDGDLLVIGEGEKEVVAFGADDIPSLSDFVPVVSDEEGAADDSEDFEDDEDYSDLDEDELRDLVVQKGLAKVRAAENMSEKKLRSLLTK